MQQGTVTADSILFLSCFLMHPKTIKNIFFSFYFLIVRFIEMLLMFLHFTPFTPCLDSSFIIRQLK